MAEEKFISIDYATWNSKYKPMEQNLAKVQAELAEEKQSKVHTLYLKIDDCTIYAYERSIFMGRTIRFHYDSDGGYFGVYRGNKILKFEPTLYATPEIDSSVIESVKKAISNYVSDNHMVTKEHLDKHLLEIEEFKKWATEKEIALNAKLKGIPKIIRWLFNLKA